MSRTARLIQFLYTVNQFYMTVLGEISYYRIFRSTQSENNYLHTKVISGQKKYPLAKPFSICLTDGFILNHRIRTIMTKGDIYEVIEV